MGVSIFLDDERNPEDVTWLELPEVNWIVVRKPEEFMSVVSLIIAYGGYIDNISFDHDLGATLTGYDLIKWLCEGIMDSNVGIPTRVLFHTQNPVGERNMRCYYRNFVENYGA